MAAPPTTARSTPTGLKMEDGFKTFIAFARAPTFCVWEVTVKPPALDGGDPINTTTMHNARVRTMAARRLYTLGNSNMRVGYDPNAYNTAKNTLINQNGGITEHFPDGSTLSYWGYLRLLDPQDHAEGEFPQANCEIVPTNTDPDDGSEAEPVLTSVSGT